MKIDANEKNKTKEHEKQNVDEKLKQIKKNSLNLNEMQMENIRYKHSDTYFYQWSGGSEISNGFGLKQVAVKL